MGRKKNKKKKELIFCYYCDRIFEDEKTLMQHQKAKHFKCPFCYKRLNSAMGLLVHCWQVHKETLEKVPGSVGGRDQFDIEIFGMSGVPPEAKYERAAKYYGERQGGAKTSEQMANQFLAGVLPGQAPQPPPVMPMPGMPMMPNPGYPFAPPMHTMYPGQPVPIHHHPHHHQRHMARPPPHHAPPPHHHHHHPHHALPPPRPAALPPPRQAPHQPAAGLPSAGRGLPVGQAPPPGHQIQPLGRGAGRGLPVGQAPPAGFGALPKQPGQPGYQPYPTSTQYQAAPPPAAAPPPRAAPAQPPARAAPAPPQKSSLPPPAAPQSAVQISSSGKKKTVRIFAHKDVSMEELRAQHPKYIFRENYAGGV